MFTYKRVGWRMKETIIFIHGLTGTTQAFKKQMEYFSDHFYTFSYSLLGHGEDRGQFVDFTLENLVRQLEDLYIQKELQDAHICSLSYGCYPSTIFAKKWPEKVKSLCYIGGHYNSSSLLFSIFKVYWKKRHEKYSDWLRQYSHDIYPKGGMLDPYAAISRKIYYKYGLELDESILKRAVDHRLTYDLRSDIRKLKVPVLWVMGEHDRLYKTSLYDLNTLLPHVVYKEIKHAGHAANLFRPNCFSDLYAEFLYSQAKTSLNK